LITFTSKEVTILSKNIDLQRKGLIETELMIEAWHINFIRVGYMRVLNIEPQDENHIDEKQTLSDNLNKLYKKPTVSWSQVFSENDQSERETALFGDNINWRRMGIAKNMYIFASRIFIKKNMCLWSDTILSDKSRLLWINFQSKNIASYKDGRYFIWR
jgi:hypothetical protein